MLYSAADAMVVPSCYEGFGQTVSESLACGTPVVAFDATGPGGIVDHMETGWLAAP
jgi:glycosyltransferase involved in cell wall biosynthesis